MRRLSARVKQIKIRLSPSDSATQQITRSQNPQSRNNARSHDNPRFRRRIDYQGIEELWNDGPGPGMDNPLSGAGAGDDVGKDTGFCQGRVPEMASGPPIMERHR